MGKGSDRRRGTGYATGYDLIWSKQGELKCTVCGSAEDEQCVCLPTDDGPKDDLISIVYQNSSLFTGAVSTTHEWLTDDKPVRRRFDKGE